MPEITIISCYITKKVQFNLIKKCEKLNLKKILLEVSQGNVTAERFYSRFDFSTVGIRKNYYKDGSHALLKEKKLTTKQCKN